MSMDGGTAAAGRMAELAGMKLLQLAKLAEDAIATAGAADECELEGLVESGDKAVRTTLHLLVVA
jgi:hypothetical protein